VKDAHPEQLCYEVKDLCRWFCNDMKLHMISIKYTGLQTGLQEHASSCEIGTDHQLQQHLLESVTVTGTSWAQYVLII